MDIRPVKDEASYDWALHEIKAYFDHPPEPGSIEADRFEVLAALIGCYETHVHPVPAADPVNVIRFVMEQSGRSQSDLAALLGSRSRASEILSGRRGLTVEMIARLSLAWSVPAGALLPNRASGPSGFGQRGCEFLKAAPGRPPGPAGAGGSRPANV